ncbi:NUDIX domain-containing protein [Chitiniphilus eburneus]|uniref:NUDIX domain-containing protein n=1 Tax=Chitiniphilus eburneus TaxID=2571148 RepID=A0A4U0PYZ1_9NEIS|nr:NUDIX domain-containing protein [Chitiniphilus eburneus]TJZ73480.1 NUDIX domain-containing protein [Chitiniphilus eburneus]
MTSQAFDTLVFIGRFQPFHDSHLRMVLAALAQARQLVLVIGSSPAHRSVRNPFTGEERRAMIEAAVAAVAPERVRDLRFVPVRDYYDGARWAAAVRRAVAGVVEPGARVGLFGHLKDDTTGYLSDFPDWPLVHQANFNGLSATPLREAWLAGHDDWRTQVPPDTAAFLDAFQARPEFAALHSEADYLAAHRRAWALAPYPPVFVTVDAVVSCRDHVLLIQRGGHPARGTWAIPGGFLDQRERVADAAVRELIEETRLAVPRETLLAVRSAGVLFDHPDRSIRGRTLTHAFHFSLPLAALPEIAAADDAIAAQWVPLAQVRQMESELCEDHFMILDRFLGLLDE